MKIKCLLSTVFWLIPCILLPSCALDKGEINETHLLDTIAETVTIAETEAEESITEEEIPTKPEIPKLDNYQGMSVDVPYTLQFQSNGDGTCVVSGIVANLLYKGTYTVEIPETSPDGETVVGMYPPKATYNLPRYLTVEDYEILDGWVEDYVNKGIEQGVFENDMNLRRFRSYYVLRSAAISSTPELREDLIAQYPLCEYVPVYALDPAITEIQLANISQLIESAAPWYTADWCYAGLLSMQSVAGLMGVQDVYLERCLSEHSYHLENADAVRIPKTVTQFGDSLTTLSYLGASLLIYDGTMEEFKAIVDVEMPTMCPLTVQCTDGELTFKVSETRYPVLAE